MNIVFPKALFVSDNKVEEFNEESYEEIQRDPRGLLLMWEPPQPHAKYIMGLDPTEGITGWNRGTRIDGDHKTDNGVIEIYRVDGTYELLFKDEKGVKIPDIDPATKRHRRLYKDVQVAEFAAPCDAVEIARIADVLGRVYAGDEEDQCMLIHEAWPGPGLLTTQELLRLGYGNLWMWQYIDSIAEDTTRVGWRSNRESQKLLWYRSRRHLMNRQVVIRSQFLLDELSNAEIDMDKMRARAAYGYHDDRMQASNMAWWAGHGWVYSPERTDEEVRDTEATSDYQTKSPDVSVSYERGLVLDSTSTFSGWRENATADWDD